MPETQLEHINLVVRDAHATAALFCRLFGWDIRWQGQFADGSDVVHVGGTHSYVALNSSVQVGPAPESNHHINGLNHLGVSVSDLDAVEKTVKDEGFSPYSYGDYEPGRRFYFATTDGIEIEVVSYE